MRKKTMNENNISPEEQNAEQEALEEAKEDEIREKVIADLDLAEDDELVEKLVAQEIQHRKKLSEAIGQKIKWREKANAAPATKSEEKVTTGSPEDILKLAEERVRETLEQRDLDELSYSDEVKAEIKKVAKLSGSSVRQAAQDSYIKHLIEQEAQEQALKEAATNSTRKRGAKIVIDPTKPLDPAQFDLSTEEGREAWEEAKQAKRQS